MKSFKNTVKKQVSRAEILLEDMRLLQKSISGKSVYKPYAKTYRRTPKYGKLEYEQYR